MLNQLHLLHPLHHEVQGHPEVLWHQSRLLHLSAQSGLLMDLLGLLDQSGP
jgi:hypothetical protein